MTRGDFWRLDGGDEPIELVDVVEEQFFGVVVLLVGVEPRFGLFDVGLIVGGVAEVVRLLARLGEQAHLRRVGVVAVFGAGERVDGAEVGQRREVVDDLMVHFVACE